MDKVVYVLCAATSALCAIKLLLAYRASYQRLLLWSGVCFALLTLSNFVLVADLVVLPESNLAFLRSGLTLAGLSVLVYGLIAETV